MFLIDKPYVSDFEKPLVLRKINFHEYPVFGFLFVVNNSTNENEKKLDLF